MKIYSFPVVISQDEDGIFVATVPDLPGCHTQAKDISTLYKRLQEAIQLCLEVQKARKQVIPQEKFIGVHQIQVSGQLVVRERRASRNDALLW